jgi:uncharacterized protein YbjQ (UPF0145 family)
MLVTTTGIVESRKVRTYHGIASGETILGANIFRDFLAGIRDIVGGRSKAYENVLRDARQSAIDEMCDMARSMGANAVVGVDLDYEQIGTGMLMVSATGTAVTLD